MRTLSMLSISALVVPILSVRKYEDFLMIVLLNFTDTVRHEEWSDLKVKS